MKAPHTEESYGTSTGWKNIEVTFVYENGKERTVQARDLKELQKLWLAIGVPFNIKEAFAGQERIGLLWAYRPKDKEIKKFIEKADGVKLSSKNGRLYHKVGFLIQRITPHAELRNQLYAAYEVINKHRKVPVDVDVSPVSKAQVLADLIFVASKK